MSLAIIIILVLITLVLLVYNIQIHKRIDTFRNVNQRVNSLNVLQQFMNTLGNNMSIEEKLDKINDTLINKYMIKYSTIVVYDGAEYIVKASNVDRKHWESLRNLQSDPVFRDSITTATPKYITVDNENEKLPYQMMEFGRAKCCKFFPLFIDNVCIGYWIIEGSEPHEFDNQDDTILEVVKNNIVTILKTVENQSTLENMVRKDLYSSLKSHEYLYTDAKKIINQYDISSVCMFKIVNLPEINTTHSRETGNRMITELSKYIQANLASQYVFVRYSGPKFVIVFSGVDKNGVLNFLRIMKPKIEEVSVISDKSTKDKEVVVKPKIRVAIAEYYKGTSLHGAIKQMEKYIDSSNMNNIQML